MISVVALLIAAAVVGMLHMSAPDHWATLVMLSKNHKWSHKRLFKNSMLTSMGHVILSVCLGFVVVGIGILTSSLILSYVTYAVGLVMLIGGVLYAVKSYRSEAAHEGNDDKRLKGGMSSFAVFGAALSPDLSVLPIFLLAIPLGLSFAAYTAIVFAVSSVVTLLIMVALGHALIDHSRISKIFDGMDPRINDALVGVTIAVVGAYILLFG